jgi:hypothetical protein
VESVLNLGLSITLVRRYGILGVAAGTAIANLLVRGWLYPRSFLRVLDVPWRVYLKHAVVPALFPAISFLLGALLYKAAFPIQGYPGLVLASASGFICFAAALWLWGMDTGERTLAVRKGREVLPAIWKTAGF